MKIVFIVLNIFLMMNVNAFPKKLEFIFLSKQTDIQALNLIPTIKTYQSVAQNFDCVPMGDGCFHPQLGLIDEKIPVKKKQKDVELNTINSEETNLVDCDPNNYFDVFCGKAKKNSGPKADLEVWIDTSSSMRNMDWNKDPTQCYRKSFVERIKTACGNISISTFNTSRKEIGSHSNACLNYGLNDLKRLMNWIRDSKANHLVVITDIDEFSRELRDFVDHEGATVHGADVKPFQAKNLLDIVPKLAETSCKKK